MQDSPIFSVPVTFEPSALPILPTRSDRPEKQPRVVLQASAQERCTIFAFPPNRDTLGGTAYLIVEESNILVDCPAWDDTNRAFLEQQGGVQWLVLTQRGGIGKAREMQQSLGCNILIQEQEAYLLPGLTVTSFENHFDLTAQTRILWTCGHSPGSSCLYHSGFGGVLFTGRHLLPNPQGKLMPLKHPKTFHWQRQLRSIEQLLQEFTPDTLSFLCPGANLGFLRGKYVVESAYQQLQQSLIQNL